MLRLDFGPDAVIKVACSTSEVAEMAGISERKVQYLVSQGLVEPSIQKASGRGQPHLFSFDDILRVRALSELRASKCSLQKLRLAVSGLRRVMNEPDPLSYVVLAYDAGRLLAFYRTNEGKRACMDALKDQPVLEIVLETIEADTIRLLLKNS